MGLLKDQADGKEPSTEEDPDKKEEDYQKLFMKIGREFVHRKDFERVIDVLIDILQEAFPRLDLEDDTLNHRTITGARIMAAFYKYNLEESDEFISFAAGDLEQLEEDEE